MVKYQNFTLTGSNLHNNILVLKYLDIIISFTFYFFVAIICWIEAYNFLFFTSLGYISYVLLAFSSKKVLKIFQGSDGTALQQEIKKKVDANL